MPRITITQDIHNIVAARAEALGVSPQTALEYLVMRGVRTDGEGWTWFDQGISPQRTPGPGWPIAADTYFHEIDPSDLPKDGPSPDVGKDFEPAELNRHTEAVKAAALAIPGVAAMEVETQQEATQRLSQEADAMEKPKKTRRRRASGTDTPDAGADFLEDPVWHREPENDDEILVRFRYHWEESVEAHKYMPGSIRKMTVVPVKDGDRPSTVRRNTLRADHLASQIPITWPIEARERGVWLRLAIDEFVKDPFSRGVDRPTDNEKYNATKVYGYDTFARHADKWLDVAVTNHPDMTIVTEESTNLLSVDDASFESGSKGWE